MFNIQDKFLSKMLFVAITSPFEDAAISQGGSILKDCKKKKLFRRNASNGTINCLIQL